MGIFGKRLGSALASTAGGSVALLLLAAPANADTTPTFTDGNFTDSVCNTAEVDQTSNSLDSGAGYTIPNEDVAYTADGEPVSAGPHTASDGSTIVIRAVGTTKSWSHIFEQPACIYLGSPASGSASTPSTKPGTHPSTHRPPTPPSAQAARPRTRTASTRASAAPTAPAPAPAPAAAAATTQAVAVPAQGIVSTTTATADVTDLNPAAQQTRTSPGARVGAVSGALVVALLALVTLVVGVRRRRSG